MAGFAYDPKSPDYFPQSDRRAPGSVTPTGGGNTGVAGGSGLPNSTVPQRSPGSAMPSGGGNTGVAGGYGFPNSQVPQQRMPGPMGSYMPPSNPQTFSPMMQFGPSRDQLRQILMQLLGGM